MVSFRMPRPCPFFSFSFPASLHERHVMKHWSAGPCLSLFDHLPLLVLWCYFTAVSAASTLLLKTIMIIRMYVCRGCLHYSVEWSRGIKSCVLYVELRLQILYWTTSSLVFLHIFNGASWRLLFKPEHVELSTTKHCQTVVTGGPVWSGSADSLNFKYEV